MWTPGRKRWHLTEGDLEDPTARRLLARIRQALLGLEETSRRTMGQRERHVADLRSAVTELEAELAPVFRSIDFLGRCLSHQDPDALAEELRRQRAELPCKASVAGEADRAMALADRLRLMLRLRARRDLLVASLEAMASTLGLLTCRLELADPGWDGRP
jgi:hypothetical protein